MSGEETQKYAEAALIVGGVRHKPHKEAPEPDNGVPQTRLVAGLEPAAQLVAENPGAVHVAGHVHYDKHHEKPTAGKDKPPKIAQYNIQQPR